MADSAPKTGAQTLTVTDAEAGQKLLQYLARRTGAPQTAVHKWIRSGQVRVDKARAKPFQRLKEGQAVRVPPYYKDEDGASLPPLPIVHEHEGLLVVAKPGGLPTHGGTGHTDSVAARLRSMRPKADFAPTPAHRLDKATSGLLTVAKTYQALRDLQELFASGHAAKTYLAWVAGSVEPGAAWTMRDQLEKTGKPGKEKVRANDAGKIALAHARCLDTRPDAKDGRSLLALDLVTGRTHQLRVQLADRGLPIIGDRKYGGPAGPDGTMLLHAARLDLAPLGPCLTLLPDWPDPYAVGPGLAWDAQTVV